MNNSGFFNIVGRLVQDIELRQSADGRTFGFARLAVQRNFKNADGNYDSDFFDVSLNGKQAEFVAQHFHKGDVIAVSGDLRTRRQNIATAEGDKGYTFITLVAENVGFVPGTKRNDAVAPATQYQTVPQTQTAASAAAQTQAVPQTQAAPQQGAFIPEAGQFPGFGDAAADDGMPF